MFRRCRKTFGAVMVAGMLTTALVGAPSALAENQYATNVSVPPWSGWIVGDFGNLTYNVAYVSGGPLCVTALNYYGGGEAGSGVCNVNGQVAVLNHPYCSCELRTAVVKTTGLGNGYVAWARDQW